jgi:hypothetical protein
MKQMYQNEAMLKKVDEETIRFMRGKYVLDEVSNGKDEHQGCGGIS